MTDLIVALGLSVLLFAAAAWKKFLTLPAAALCCAFLLLISLCSGWQSAVFLLASYALLVIADLAVKRRAEKAVEGVHKKEKGRSVVQVLANGSFAAFASVLFALTKNTAFLYSYLICVAEVCADSVASDVGVLSRRRPVSIITFRRVETGISGGVSLLGMTASLIMCLLCAALGILCVGFSVKGILLLTFLPYFGMITDSILGATVQGKYRCAVCGKATEKAEHCETPTVLVGGCRIITNTLVNAITNLLCGIAGFILAELLF